MRTAEHPRLAPIVVTVPSDAELRPTLTTWKEAVLAVGLTLVLGLGFWLFAGGPDATGSTDDTTPTPIDTEAAARGEVLAVDTGCLACHTLDGIPSSGPTWKGLAGSSRPLESGETVTADDAYLRRSITDPNAEVVAGFSAVMPTTYSDQLSDQEITDLVEYLKSLA